VYERTALIVPLSFEIFAVCPFAEIPRELDRTTKHTEVTKDFEIITS
jgi:hypothetical protein